jgi:hypothetical protein
MGGDGEEPDTNLAGRATALPSDGLLQDRRGFNSSATDVIQGQVKAAPAAALQHSLPAQLNVDPTRLLAMHDSFFLGNQGGDLDVRLCDY